MAELSAAQMMESKKRLDRTEDSMWEEEGNDVWMIEADNSWLLDIVIRYEVVAAILNDILIKVC